MCSSQDPELQADSNQLTANVPGKADDQRAWATTIQVGDLEEVLYHPKLAIVAIRE